MGHAHGIHHLKAQIFTLYPACTEPLNKRLGGASVQGCIYKRLLASEKKS